MQNTDPKRRDKQYRKYLAALIEEFNSNGKRTILMTCDTFYPIVDGVVNVLDNYARLLYGEMNVLVLAPTCGGRIPQRSYPVLGVTSLFSKKLNYQIALPAFDRQCAKLLKKLRIDLIHCHSPFFLGRYVAKLHKKRNIPMVTTFHSQYKRDFTKYVGNGILNRFLMRFVMKVFNRSDEVWTMHTASRDTIISYGYRGKVRLIPNGTPFAPASDYAAERRESRKKYGVTDEPLFVFVGRLVEQKNIFFVASVLGEMKRRGYDFKMLFVGEGPDHGKLEKKLKAEGVLENTVFTGHVGDPAALSGIYSAADLFLFPSMYDVSSIVQIEAASRYTPTAFAEGSVTSCTVTNGVNGYIFPCDLDSYTNGVIRAVDDPEELRRIGENAFRDLYVSWESVIRTVAQHYEELITAHR